MNDHIAKPIDEAGLWATLSRWIAPQERAGHLPAAHRDRRSRNVPDIPGLDATAGLAHAGGKTELYDSLLRKFASGQRGFPAALRRALEAGDRALAERLAHTLKGVAATVGARDIQARAACLEQSIAQGDDPALSEALIAPLASALGELIAHIDALPPKEAKVGREPATDFDPYALAETCRALTRMLSEGDAEGFAVFERNSGTLKAAYPLEFSELSAAVRAYDFETAERILSRRPAAGLDNTPGKVKAGRRESA
jgi:two-component system sensor histidine kinase/response regulator